MTLRFHNNCVNTHGSEVRHLTQMIQDSILISRETFLKHVHRGDLAALEQSLSYERHPKQGLTMAGDWHVSYHRSKWRGWRCYYFRHSAIEFYFTREGDGCDD